MAVEVENAVREFLRPLEELKVILKTIVLSPRTEEGAANQPNLKRNKDPDPWNAERFLTVVTRASGRNGVEEGSIFILKFRADFTPGSITVQHIFPIYGDFSITMAQSRRGTLDLTSKSALTQPRSEFTLTINAGRNDLESLTLLTNDMQRLRAVIQECKRLKEIANTSTSIDYEKRYAWTAPYTRTEMQPRILAAPDIRTLCQPLHTRLSPASAGLPGDDAADIGIICEDWIRSRAHDFCSKAGGRLLRLRLGTFNVNGKDPSQDLSPWVRGSNADTISQDFLPPLKTISPLSLGEDNINPLDKVKTHSTQGSDTTTLSIASSKTLTLDNSRSHTSGSTANEEGDGPDILALGFQELDLSVETLIYSTSTAKEDAWCMAIFAGLGERAILYEKLASKQLVGMLLLIVVKKSMRSCFSDIKFCAAGAGIMGIMGNKGATAISLIYTPRSSSEIVTPSPITLTFVNSHLAPFDEMIERRNSDFHDLSKRLIFDSRMTLDTPPSTETPPAAISIYETDALFWMGDLNYRIDLADADVRDILASNVDDRQIKMLLQYDQLRSTLRSKNAFQYFNEEEITHLPTYRFSSGMLTDSLGYDRKRKPAWTDRILHMSSPRARVTQLSYCSHRSITMSDHRPVSGDFSIQASSMDSTEYEAVVHTLCRQVSGMEEPEDNPKIKIETTSIDLGKISYKRRVSRVLTLENIGKIPCAYRFIPLDFKATPLPGWLRVEPMVGLILPDESVTITIAAYVDNDSASRLNLGPSQLDTTLILHTMLGKDHFISLTAEYEYTCFANKLSRLVRLPGPIRDLKSSQDLLAEDKAINAPREVMRLVKWMMSNSSDLDQLFLSPAPEDIAVTIRECLDTGADFPFHSSSMDDQVVAGFWDVLTQLLGSLPDPLVPPTLHSSCVQATNRDEAFEVLGEFPNFSVNVWISVTAFLHFIGQQSMNDGSEANTQRKMKQLASILAPILLRDDPALPSSVSPVGKRNFLLFFIS